MHLATAMERGISVQCLLSRQLILWGFILPEKKHNLPILVLNLGCLFLVGLPIFGIEEKKKEWNCLFLVGLPIFGIFFRFLTIFGNFLEVGGENRSENKKIEVGKIFQVGLLTLMAFLHVHQTL